MSKGIWPRPVNKKKFDEEFDRIFLRKIRRKNVRINRKLSYLINIFNYLTDNMGYRPKKPMLSGDNTCYPISIHVTYMFRKRIALGDSLFF